MTELEWEFSRLMRALFRAGHEKDYDLATQLYGDGWELFDRLIKKPAE